MTHFLKQLILFAVGILLFNAVLWLLSRHLLFEDYGDGFMEVSQAPYEVILVGDSHVAALAQADVNKRTMNFGYNSDSVQNVLAKLLYCLEKGEGLKLLVIQAGDHLLNAHRIQINNRKRSVGFLSLPTYRATYGGRAREYLWEKYVESYLPVVALDRSELFRRAIHAGLKKWLRQGLLGAEAPAAPVDDWSRLSAAERRQAADERVRVVYSTEQSAVLQEALLKIVEIGRRQGIRILGIKYPVTPEYRELAGARFDGQPVAEILRTEGVEVMDFLTLYDAHPEFFKDADHLNSRGAQVFGQLLSDLLDQHLIADGK